MSWFYPSCMTYWLQPKKPLVHSGRKDGNLSPEAAQQSTHLHSACAGGSALSVKKYSSPSPYIWLLRIRGKGKQLREQRRCNLTSSSAMARTGEQPISDKGLSREPHLCHAALHAPAGSRSVLADPAHPQRCALLTWLAPPRSPAGIPAREGSLQAAALQSSVPVARLLRWEPAESRQVATVHFCHSPAERCLQSHLTECKTKIKTFFFFSLTLRTVCYIIRVCI